VLVFLHLHRRVRFNLSVLAFNWLGLDRLSMRLSADVFAGSGCRVQEMCQIDTAACVYASRVKIAGLFPVPQA
jgi:hypothetical protein